MLKGFEGQKHAELYAKYRPTYPDEVAKKVVDYARKNKADGKLSHMVDVGCGNGQSTTMYETYFDKITALDTSASQIEQASAQNKSSNINYVVSPGENLPVEEESVDVICSGQAIHWVDFQKFWDECRRVLKADGSLVLYGYDMPHLVPAGDVPVDLTREELKNRTRQLTKRLHEDCKFHPRIDHVNNLYVEIFDLIPCKEKHRDDTLKIERNWTLEGLGNYLTTWSGYQTYLRERNPDDKSPDVLRLYLDRVKKLFGMEDVKDADIPLLVSWDIFILFSKKP